MILACPAPAAVLRKASLASGQSQSSKAITVPRPFRPARCQEFCVRHLRRPFRGRCEMEAENLLAEAVRELDAEIGTDVGLAKEAFIRLQEEKHRIEQMVWGQIALQILKTNI